MTIEQMKKRLNDLNKLIDAKILAGKGYSKEAKEHANIRAFLLEHKAI